MIPSILSDSSCRVGSVGDCWGLGSEGGRPFRVSCLRSSSAKEPGTYVERLSEAEALEATEVASVRAEEPLRTDRERERLLSSSGSSSNAKLLRSLWSPNSSVGAASIPSAVETGVENSLKLERTKSFRRGDPRILLGLYDGPSRGGY